MNKSRTHFLQLGITVFLIISFSNRAWSTDLTVQIRSPKDESTITQEQAYILVGGKAEVQTGRAGYVDIFLVIDVSASTALYAGVDFSEFSRSAELLRKSTNGDGTDPSANCSTRTGAHLIYEIPLCSGDCSLPSPIVSAKSGDDAGWRYYVRRRRMAKTAFDARF